MAGTKTSIIDAVFSLIVAFTFSATAWLILEQCFSRWPGRFLDPAILTPPLTISVKDYTTKYTCFILHPFPNETQSTHFH